MRLALVVGNQHIPSRPIMDSVLHDEPVVGTMCSYQLAIIYKNLSPSTGFGTF